MEQPLLNNTINGVTTPSPEKKKKKKFRPGKIRKKLTSRMAATSAILSTNLLKRHQRLETGDSDVESSGKVRKNKSKRGVGIPSILSPSPKQKQPQKIKQGSPRKTMGKSATMMTTTTTISSLTPQQRKNTNKILTPTQKEKKEEEKSPPSANKDRVKTVTSSPIKAPATVESAKRGLSTSNRKNYNSIDDANDETVAPKLAATTNKVEISMGNEDPEEPNDNKTKSKKIEDIDLENGSSSVTKNNNKDDTFEMPTSSELVMMAATGRTGKSFSSKLMDTVITGSATAATGLCAAQTFAPALLHAALPSLIPSSNASLVTTISGSATMALAPYVVYQRQQLNQMETTRSIINQMREKAEKFRQENLKLTKKINKLERSVIRLADVKTNLDAIILLSGKSNEHFTEIVKEIKSVQTRMATVLKARVIQRAFNLIMRSDRDDDLSLDEEEMEILIIRLGLTRGIEFNEELFRLELSKHSGPPYSVEYVLSLVRSLLDGDHLNDDDTDSESDESEDEDGNVKKRDRKSVSRKKSFFTYSLNNVVA